MEKKYMEKIVKFQKLQLYLTKKLKTEKAEENWKN